MSRRDELVRGATDYVLAHGLVGLSLRPLADALGTSDRMLLYHFGTKEHLVAAILRASNDRSVSEIRALPPAKGVRRAVLDVWDVMTSSPIAACARMYVEASALGLLGREPYASVVKELNEDWMAALADHLVASGATRGKAARIAALVDSAVMGLFLDRPLEEPEQQRRTVQDLAEASARI